MRSFRDDKSREWVLRVDVDVLREWRAKLGLTFDGLVTGHFSALSDHILAIDAITLACADQLAFRGVDAKEFGRGLAGDVLGAAVAALVDACLDFFPDRATREYHRAALEKGRELVSMAMQEATKEIGKVETTEAMERLKTQFFISQESSASTQALTPAPN